MSASRFFILRHVLLTTLKSYDVEMAFQLLPLVVLPLHPPLSILGYCQDQQIVFV